MNIKRIALLLLLFNLTFIFSQDEVYIEKMSAELLDNENRFDLDNSIYRIDKSFLFSYSLLKNGINVDSDLKQIEMFIKGTTKPFSNIDPEYSQTVIQFNYFGGDGKSSSFERTGLVENNKNIWIHPPRTAETGILQLSAFPFIKFDKKKWTWTLDAAFQNYQDVHLVHSYKKLSPINYTTDFGVLKCIPIHAETKSHIGTTYSEFLFNETHGFVRLEFRNIDNTTMLLELIKPKG